MGKVSAVEKGFSHQDPRGTRLSELYRNTIRQQTDPEALGSEDKMKKAVQTMKTAILAVLYHECQIPDNEPSPSGEDS